MGDIEAAPGGQRRPHDDNLIQAVIRILDDLTEDNFRRLKWFLRTRREVPVSRLERADRPDTVDLLFSHFPQERLEILIGLLADIDRNDLVVRLSRIQGDGIR